MRRTRQQWAHIPALTGLIVALISLSCCGLQDSAPPVLLYNESLTSYRKANLQDSVRLADRGTQRYPPPWKQRFTLLRVQVLLAQNQVDLATDTLRNSDLHRMTDPALVARLRMLEGNILMKRSRYAEAHAAFQRAWDQAESVEASDVQIEIRLLQSATYWRQHDLQAGYPLLQQAFALAQKNNDVYHQAAVLLNLSAFSLARFRYDEAVPILKRVLAMAEPSDAVVLRSGALGNLALCYSQLGEYSKALDARRQAITLQRAAGLEAYVMDSLGEMGVLNVVVNQPAEAVPWFRQALDMARQVRSPADTAMWSSHLAQALASTEKWDEAEQINVEALRIRTELKDGSGTAFTKLVSAKIEAGRGRREATLRLYAEVLRMSSDPSLVWEANAGLARVYSESGDHLLAKRHYRIALQAIDNTSSELLRGESKITFLDRLIDFYRDYVHYLVRVGEDVEALGIADSTHARLISESVADNRPFTRKDPKRFVEMFRQSREVAFCYWLGPNGSSLWVLKGGRVSRFDLPPSKTIAGLVAAHHASIVDRMGDPQVSDHSAALDLYKILIKPAEHLLEKDASVLIVPDGVLNGLNFETLVSPSPRPHYWIGDVTISITPALHLLSASRHKIRPRGSGLLLLGDPEEVDAEYPKLRYAAAEIAAIRQQVGGGDLEIMTGAAATPIAYESADLKRFSLLHFTSHASANYDSPLDSAIVLSPASGRYKLYGRDVAGRALSANLVTVSACRSASARTYAGEGSIGFAWAFLKAGADNVVAGLWDVSDRSTAHLMSDLYAGLIKDYLTPAKALRRAKLALIARGGAQAKPYYWAPFQVYTQVRTKR